MKKLGKFLTVLFLIITGVFFYNIYIENQRKKRERAEKEEREKEEQRLKLFDLFNSKIDIIKHAVLEFLSLTNFENGYLSNYQLSRWKEHYNPLYQSLVNEPYENIKLIELDIKTIKSFFNYFEKSEDLRKDFNNKFIKKELEIYDSFFNNIEGRKLDIQQRTAIVSDEDNNIVIAGAGSGKTTTIVGKVNYIVDRYKINPDEILLISFTRKSASTLASRINMDGANAKTFHKFGIDVICEVDNKQPSIYDEAQFKYFITRTFNELLKDENYLKNVTSFFTDYLKPVKPQEDFENQGTYYQYIKDHNFRTYKQKPLTNNGRTTYKMEVVKSIEECKIANFLLFNSIDYEYEMPYEHETADKLFHQYKPDFTIIQNGERIYIEHFALNHMGTVPHFFANVDGGETLEEATKKYKDGIKWKRELHNNHQTRLIETYSYEMYDETLFENLTDNLTKSGIILTPKSPKEIWQIISEAAKDEVDNIISLFLTFITLMKSNNFEIKDLNLKCLQQVDIFEKERNELFIRIIEPIFNIYQNHLIERKEIDFNDMINKATSYINSGLYDKKYKYIIIDEFQDISIGRYQLIKSLKTVNPACKLFAVGDDWQSIYRFSGSDIALFKEFENYFGYTLKSKIETTYRFNDPLISLSSEFILKNPNQTTKELKGLESENTTTYRIVYSKSNDQDDTIALKEVFDSLITDKETIEDKEILILGRYSFDINRIKNEKSIFQINNSTGEIRYIFKNEDGKEIKINAQFLTVHKAKGIEADIVVIINCNSGKHGFPSEMSDDKVLNLLLSEADQFENGEERRLFYVAMTRAKESVILVTDNNYKSKFITELEIGSDNLTLKCPRCKTADLKLKTGTTNNRNWGFYSCSNYLYGCEYMQWI